MSYSRLPYYIFSDGENINFDFIQVPEDMTNVFIYKLVTFRQNELKERVQKGFEKLMEYSDFKEGIK
jgi:hypothetical protein